MCKKQIVSTKSTWSIRADELRRPRLVDRNLDGLMICPMDEWSNKSYGWAAGVRPSGRAAPKCNSAAKAVPEYVVVVIG